MKHQATRRRLNMCFWRALTAMTIYFAILSGCVGASAQMLPGQPRNRTVARPTIDFLRRALTISVPIVGVPFRLNYRSDAVAPKWRWSIYHAYDPGTNIFSPGNGWPRVVTPLFQQSTKPPAWLGVGEMAIVAQDASEIYIFDLRGDHLRTLNALTGAMVYRFDYADVGVLTAITDAYGNTTKIERDARGFMTAVIAPHGQRTTFKNNDKGNPTGIANPLGETISLDYSPNGQLAVFTDPNKDIYHFTTDQSGLLTRLEGPDGGFVDLTQTLAESESKLSWTTAMERRSAWVAERTPDGEISAVNTDPAGSQTRIQNGTGDTTKVAYPDGRTITQVQGADPRWGRQSPVLKTLALALPSGLTVSLSTNRTVSLQDASNPLSLTNLTEAATINGHNYKRIFDAKNRQVTQVTPSGRRVISTLDKHGRLATVEVQGLLPISLTYDSHGRLINLRQGEGTEARSASLEYTAEGWLASVTDPVKRTLRFEHDAAGRVSKRALQDGTELALKYDANGNLISVTPPGRPSHSFQYTPNGEVSAYVPPRVDQVVGNPAGKSNLWNSITSFLANVWSTIKFYVRKLFKISKAKSSADLEPGDIVYVYDKDRQLMKTVRPDGSTAEFVYDKGGHLTALKGAGAESRLTYEPKTAKVASIASSDGSTLSQTYDGSLLTRLEWTGPVTGTVAFTYESSLRVSSTTVNGGSPISMGYDPDGLLTQAGNLKLTRDGSTGFLTNSVLGNVATTREYSGFGEPILFRATFKKQEILVDRYDRDALGRVVQKTETIDGQSNVYKYAYDLAGRLTDVSANGTLTAHYEYDPNGNRVGFVGPNSTVRANYDAQDRLKQYGSDTYAYTANGEWLSRTVESKTTAYSYDAFGNLKTVSLPDGAKIDYVVDGFGRRIGKRVNGKLVQGFLYSNQLKLIAELDGDNQVISRFVYATHSNVPDYMMKGGKTYRIITDVLGSPRLVVDTDTGAIAQRMDYDEFGNVLRDTKSGFQPFGFAGGLYDADTKLIRFGTRDFDAVTGRWTAKDPIGFLGTDTNLYAYVSNDPVNGRDVVGTQVSKDYTQLFSPDINVSGTSAVAPPNPYSPPNATPTDEPTWGGLPRMPSFWDCLGGLIASGTIAETGAGSSLVWGTGSWAYYFGGAATVSSTAGLFTTLGAAVAAGLAGYGAATVMMHNPFSDYLPSGIPGYSWGDLGRGQLGGDFADLFGGAAADLWHCYGPGNWFGFGDASGCGSGTGDIHMATFDGLRYDLQAAGEFLASQDLTGKTKIQVRLEPNETHSVSYCTAVAARVDGANVSIQVKPRPQVYIDSKAVNIEPGRGIRLGKGGEIRLTDASEWTITWPDNTGVRVKPQGSYFDVVFRPGASAGKLVGLLGNGDGNPTGDLVTRDGTALEKGFTSKDLYGRFAESWRITQNESLFHYAKGESTATFTDRTVPRQNVTVETLDPAARAEAERQCRAAGITAPAALSDCIVDFAVTGNRRFLASAALDQAIRPELAVPSPGAIASEKQAGSVMVSGTGKDAYSVFDGAGKAIVVANRNTNSPSEIPAGTYTVNLNGSQQRLEVRPGQQSVVQAGSLIISGIGKETYQVYDSSGNTLVNLRPTNSATELFPGTYTVLLNGSQQHADVTPSQQTVIQAGSVIVSGTGKETYDVLDSTGKATLVNFRRTNSATELFPGAYTVNLNSSRQRVDVTAGQQAVVRAGSLMVSGNGNETYDVLDSTGKATLVNFRRTNSATELLPGTYVVKIGERGVTISIQAGHVTTVNR